MSNALAEQLSNGMVGLAEVYAPAIIKMALDQLVALTQLANGAKTEEALAIVRQSMDYASLLAEKKAINAILARCAQADYDANQLASTITLGALKIIIGVALAAVA